MSYKQKPIQDKQEFHYTPRIQKIMDLHDRANIIYVLKQEDYSEMEFYDALSRNTNPNNHRVYIGTIYRVKTEPRFTEGGFTEALVYYKSQELEKTSGEPLHDNLLHEFYWNPITRPKRNNEGQATQWDPKYYEPYYTLEFTPQNFQMVTSQSLNSVSDFCVALSSRQGPEKFVGNPLSIWNVEDFVNATWQELVDMNQYNYTKRDPSLAQWRLEGETIKKNNQNLIAAIGGNTSVIQNANQHNQSNPKQNIKPQK
ncbi:MAG: hypothetical protein ACTHME_03315 [Candidatus Nitrosocosmicus sp.]